MLVFVSTVPGGFFNKRTVNAQRTVRDNLLDDALLLQVGQTSASNGAVDLHSVDQDRDGDQAVGLDIFVKLVRGGLVEEDGVLGLVLDYIAIQSVMGFQTTALAVDIFRNAEEQSGNSRTLSLRPLLLSLLGSGVCWSLTQQVSMW